MTRKKCQCMPGTLAPFFSLRLGTESTSALCRPSVKLFRGLLALGNEAVRRDLFRVACVAVVFFFFTSAKSEREMGAKKSKKKRGEGGREGGRGVRGKKEKEKRFLSFLSPPHSLNFFASFRAPCPMLHAFAHLPSSRKGNDRHAGYFFWCGFRRFVGI